MTGFIASAQKQSEADSTQIVLEKPEHSPHKATIYSTILPGLGQIYNKKYWKLPIIYIGFGALGYFINYNNDLYIEYKQAYADIIDDNPNTNSFMQIDNYEEYWKGKETQFSSRLKTAKDGSRRNRDFVIICTVAFYALNIIDATVDAHFFDFDISDDLSFQWTPGPVYCFNQKLVGIHCRIRF